MHRETSPIDTTPDPNPTSDTGPRFLAADLPNQPGSTFTLDRDQARHATRVLRLSEGSPIQLIDGKGTTAHATITSTDPGQTTCTITAIDHTPAPSPRIELATAIPKGPRADGMVNDLAQLGADVLIPLITERSVVHPRDNKLSRFEKAAVEAGKQSGNRWLMRIEKAAAFGAALICDAQLKLVADPDAEPIPGLSERLDSVSAVRVLIGPEGGLTDAERAAAIEAGFIPWTFSSNVLRIETAAIAALAILRSQA
ncbi:MAG: RsmE family RNA methyltransferase [Planctomycetota bacterium]